MTGAGSGFGQLIPLAMMLVGILGILRARRARRRGEDRPDAAAEDRRAATLETERRMAAYLAQRDGGGYRAMNDRDGRENGP